MASKRRRIKNRETPVRCSLCKEKKAFHTMHGSYLNGGHTCCDDCWPDVKKKAEEKQVRERSWEPSEADRQTWMRL